MVIAFNSAVKIVEGLDRVIGSGSETAASENFGGGFLSLSLDGRQLSGGTELPAV